MTPLGVHHVSINVRDAAEGVAFYTDVLGLATRDDRPDFGIGGAWLDIGGQQVHLIETSVPDDCGQHFAIHVADIDAAVAELARARRRGQRPEAGGVEPAVLPARPVRQPDRTPRTCWYAAVTPGVRPPA